MQNARISWIDVARGLAILFVIYGHGLAANSPRFLIYSFHMPLFFFLSGYVFHSRKNGSFFASLKKDFRRIMIPYFIFAAISYSLWLSNVPPDNRTAELLSKQAYGILYGNGNNGYLAINIVLWFLPTLFVTRTIFYHIAKLQNKKNILFSLALISIIGYTISVALPKTKLPWGVEAALNAVVFFGLGFLSRELPEKLVSYFKTHMTRSLLLLIIIFLLSAGINYAFIGAQVDIRLNRLGDYFLFYGAALSAITLLILASIKIQSNRVLEILGKNTMPLFVFHLIVFSYISRFLMLFISSETIIELRNIYLAPTYTLLSILIILGLSSVYKKLQKTITLN